MTSRLTRPSPSSRSSRRNPGQSGVLFRRDRLSPNQLNHQDPFILRHGSQPTANRLPLLSWGNLCKAHCSVLVRRLDTFASCSNPTTRRPRTCRGGEKAAQVVTQNHKAFQSQTELLFGEVFHKVLSKKAKGS